MLRYLIKRNYIIAAPIQASIVSECLSVLKECSHMSIKNLSIIWINCYFIIPVYISTKPTHPMSSNESAHVFNYCIGPYICYIAYWFVNI